MGRVEDYFLSIFLFLKTVLWSGWGLTAVIMETIEQAEKRYREWGWDKSTRLTARCTSWVLGLLGKIRPRWIAMGCLIVATFLAWNESTSRAKTAEGTIEADKDVERHDKERIEKLRDLLTEKDAVAQQSLAQEKKLDELEKQMAALNKMDFLVAGRPLNPKEWPALTDTQITEWSARLSGEKVEDFFVAYRDGQSLEFGVSLIKIAEKRQWHRQIDAQAAVPPGITIYCSKSESAAGALADLLKAAGYVFAIESGHMPPGHVAITIGEKK